MRINVRKRGCEHRVTVLLIHMLTGKDNETHSRLSDEDTYSNIPVYIKEANLQRYASNISWIRHLLTGVSTYLIMQVNLVKCIS